MSKIVRLTESDLVRLVKKVLNEQNPGGNIPNQDVLKCFSDNTKITDLAKIPTCVAIATEVMQTKKLPTDMQKGMKCANEMASAIGDDPFSAFAKLTSVAQCLIEKVTTQTPTRY